MSPAPLLRATGFKNQNTQFKTFRSVSWSPLAFITPNGTFCLFSKCKSYEYACLPVSYEEIEVSPLWSLQLYVFSPGFSWSQDPGGYFSCQMKLQYWVGTRYVPRKTITWSVSAHLCCINTIHAPKCYVCLKLPGSLK